MKLNVRIVFTKLWTNTGACEEIAAAVFEVGRDEQSPKENKNKY